MPALQAQVSCISASGPRDPECVQREQRMLDRWAELCGADGVTSARVSAQIT
jgi:hypothetical protein